MTETAKKRAAAPKTVKQPEIVKIAWWNRPITWGLVCLFLLLLVASSLMGTGGPETGEAQEVKAEVEVLSPFAAQPEPTIVCITADNGAVVIQGGGLTTVNPNIAASTDTK